MFKIGFNGTRSVMEIEFNFYKQRRTIDILNEILLRIKSQETRHLTVGGE